MPYSSVEVVMMRPQKRHRSAQTVGSEQIKDLQNPLVVTSQLGHSSQCGRGAGDCTGPLLPWAIWRPRTLCTPVTIIERRLTIVPYFKGSPWNSELIRYQGNIMFLAFASY